MEILKQLAAKVLPAGLAVVRNTVPNIAVGSKFGLVTRFDDVVEVLGNDGAFMVTYEPKMRVVAGGSNFFLGMGDTAQYHRDVTNWRDVFPAAEAAGRIAQLSLSQASEIINGAAGSVDVVSGLAQQVACATVETYMGITGPTRPELVDWSTRLFAYLFYPSDSTGDRQAERISLTARRHIDTLISERKARHSPADDGISRALQFQSEGRDGFSDEEIRNNLLGIVVGAIPTTSKCVALVLDYLLDHPDHLAGARAAALNNDWELVNGYVNECLRFNPFGPVLLRECVKDHKVAAGTMRARTFRKGSTVAVATLSAMFDRRAVNHPHRFDPERDTNIYLTYGAGMHTCFGLGINSVQIARIVGALIVKPGLRRADSAAGKLQTEGQFPTHLRVVW